MAHTSSPIGPWPIGHLLLAHGPYVIPYWPMAHTSSPIGPWPIRHPLLAHGPYVIPYCPMAHTSSPIGPSTTVLKVLHNICIVFWNIWYVLHNICFVLHSVCPLRLLSPTACSKHKAWPSHLTPACNKPGVALRCLTGAFGVSLD